MTPNSFDDLAKGLAKETSRRNILRMLGIGVVGGAVAAAGVRRTEAAPTCRALGEACQSDVSCCGGNAAGTGSLFCQQVGATGAHRCECNVGAGFEQCNNQCVPAGTCGQPQGCPTGTETCTPSGGTASCYATCTGGTVRNLTTCACECASGQVLCNGSCVAACSGNQVLNSSCQCVCPTGTQTCTPTGGSAACYPTCPSGQVFTSSCTCGCPAGSTFCNGQCVPLTAGQVCPGCHNKVFNAQCCSCENPGQPSGKCRGVPCTTAGCTC